MQPPQTEELTLKGKTLLVVDDEQVVRNVLRRYFERKGAEILTASNGAEALQTLSRRSVHLILLDVRMPVMDGIETLRRMRDAALKIPVIMITATEDEETAKLTLELGAKDFIQKPIDLDYLDMASTWLSWMR